MNKKTAVVTGANSGIGKITARAHLEDGYRVLMICRNPEKAKNARKEITEETGNDQADILICDLSDMSQIRETAARIRENYNRLDRLVNNAGLLADANREENSDGIELTFAVNHLAYFLLTKELMPLLEITPDSRIINVASNAHRYGEFDPDNLQLQRGYTPGKAYGNSKLFNIMFTHHLNKKLAGKDITTYSLHPGVVNTNFASDSDSMFAKFFSIVRFFMLSPEKGAETTIFLCTEPGIEKYSGKYFSESKPVKPKKEAATDDDACKLLWEMSEELVQDVLSSKNA